MIVKLPRLLVAALALVAGAATCLVGAGPAAAVQTDSWGMSAATQGGAYQAEIVHPADGTQMKSLILVWNRTTSPLTVQLSVLSVTPENDTFAYSPTIKGLAAGIALPITSVTLGAKQEARVEVSIRWPSGSSAKEYAAIGGESQPVHEGVLSVQERLAVIVEASAHGAPAATGVPGAGQPAVPAAVVPAVPGKSDGHSPSVSGPVLFFGSIGAVFLLIILVLCDRERRRKDSEVVAEAAAGAPLTAAYLAALPPPSERITTQ